MMGSGVRIPLAAPNFEIIFQYVKRLHESGLVGPTNRPTCAGRLRDEIKIAIDIFVGNIDFDRVLRRYCRLATLTAVKRA